MPCRRTDDLFASLTDAYSVLPAAARRRYCDLHLILGSQIASSARELLRFVVVLGNAVHDVKQNIDV